MKSKFVDKFVYDKKEDQRIITHEGMMLEAYAKAVACYSPLFAQYGCSLEVSLYWVDFSTRKCYDHRLPFRIGYACYVCCEVQRDGEVVHVKSTDGEADYYTLSTERMVSAIDRDFFQTKVSLYSDSDEAEDMEELLRQLSNSQQETDIKHSNEN